jgi:hypothetical protein
MKTMQIDSSNSIRSLSHLPQDLIGLIASFLTSNDVLHLTLCGSSQLNLCLGQTVRNLFFDLDGFAPLPLSSYHFPKLERLHISMTKYYVRYPLRLIDNRVFPLNSMETMIELKVNFAQSWLFLEGEELNGNLASIFPNLQLLHLSGSRRQMTNRQWRNLPRTIVDLALSSSSTADANADVDDLSPFPPLLEMLVLNISIGFMKSLTQKIIENKLKFPTTLKTLSLNSVSDHRLFEHFPPSLEMLDFTLWNSNDNNVLTSLLPPTLTSLSIMGDGRLVIDSSFNPNMKSLLLARNPVTVTDDPVTLSHLPKSIVDCSFIPTMFRIDKRQPFPPHLESLTLDRAMWKDCKSLPPCLRQLYISDAYLSNNIHIKLPSTLTHLSMILSDSKELKKLPPKLESLLLIPSNFYSSRYIHRKDWSYLPQSLTSISLSIVQIWNGTCLKAFPSNLRHLAFLPGDNRTLPSRLAVDGFDNMGMYFPSSLEKLVINVGHHDVLFWPTCLIQMSSVCLNLKSLEMFHDPDDIESCKANLDPSFVSKLPRTLEILRLIASSSWRYNLNFLINLPSSLHSLYIYAPHRSNCKLTDEHLRKLPRHLTELIIAGRDKHEFTEKVLDYIPPGVSNCLLSGLNVTENIQNQFVNHPRWKGEKIASIDGGCY